MVLPRLPKQVADKARSFACGLYKNVPGALIPNAGEDALRYVWDNFCDPPSNPQEPSLPGLPPPPIPQFQGGQCAISYKVDITMLQTSGNVTSVSVYCRGPIQGYTWRWDGTYNICELTAYTYTGEYKPQNHYVFGARPSSYPGLRPRTDKISALGGGTDNCGNPPKQYPLPPGPPPNTIFTSPPTPITLNDDDVINIIFNLVPPRTPLPLDKLPPIVVNVASPKFNIPISFNFNGDVNFGAPEGGGDNLDELKDKIDNLDDKIDDLTDNTDNLPDFFKDFDFRFNPPSFKDSPEVDKVPLPDSQEGEKDGVEDMLGALIVLTQLPQKVQYGAPNCYFAGWITFKTQDGQFPREQINFERSYFEAPPGATGIAYTFTNGAEGEVTLYSKKPET